MLLVVLSNIQINIVILLPIAESRDLYLEIMKYVHTVLYNNYALSCLLLYA